MDKSQIFEMGIESLAAGGDGVGRHEGKTIFTPGVAPGDRVACRVVRDRGSWAKAETVELIAPGPDRVEPPCPVAGRCGGCQWQHVALEAQRAARRAVVEDALRRIAGLENWPDVEFAPTLNDGFGYRCRGEYHGQLRSAGELDFGFFARGSHEIVNHDACPILEPPLAAAMAELRERLRLELHQRCRFQIETTLLQGPALQLLVNVEPEAARPMAEALADWRPSNMAAAHVEIRFLGRRGVFREAHGAPFVRDTLELEDAEGGALEIPLYTRPGEFVQANTEANAELIGALLNAASLEKDGWILDLYCGAGNFTLPLALAGARVLGIETRRSALRSARRTTRDLGLGRARFRAGRVADLLPQLAREGKTYSTVVLDPPRQGAPELKDYLDPLNVEEILAVSCHPATLARDLKGWLERGFALESLRLFDFFPQTYHVEVLARLGR